MIERWTPKIKRAEEQIHRQTTELFLVNYQVGMWTDKEGEYVLYADHIKAVSEAYHNGKESHHQKL